MTLVIGHRGDSAHALENTMDAFRKAWKAGAQMVEMDVRLAADGEVVVFHDPTLRRLFGNPGRISRLTTEQIKERSQGAIPLLSEVLEEFRGKLKFYVEVKALRLRRRPLEALVEQTYKTIAASGVRADCLIASFNYRVPVLYRRHDPKGWTGFIVSRRGALGVARRDRFAHVHAICPHKSLLTPAFVRHCRQWGQQIFPWVLDNAKEQRHAMSLGVDGIVSNDPGALRRRLLKNL